MDFRVYPGVTLREIVMQAFTAKRRGNCIRACGGEERAQTTAAPGQYVQNRADAADTDRTL